MKKLNKLLFLLPALACLSACTMVSVNVNQPPQTVPNDHVEIDPDKPDQGETDSGETDQGKPDQGETDQGETDQGDKGPTFSNLTYQEAEPKIKAMIEYINSDQYVSPRHYTSDIFLKLPDLESKDASQMRNISSISAIDFDKYQFERQTLDKLIGKLTPNKPTIKSDSTRYIYKDSHVDNRFINAFDDRALNTKTYDVNEVADPNKLNEAFYKLVGKRPGDNKNITLFALESCIASGQVAKDGDLVDILIDEEKGDLKLQIETVRDLHIPIVNINLKNQKVKVTTELKNYQVTAFDIIAAPEKDIFDVMSTEIRINVDYNDIEFTEPNLELYTLNVPKTAN